MGDKIPKWKKGAKSGAGNYEKAMKRVMAAASQMHEKKGEMYERYLRSQYIRIVKEMHRLAITPPYVD